MASSTPSNGLDTANQKETSQPEPWALGSVFILCFSSVRRSTFHVARNFFRNVERTQENLDRRVGTRGLGENATWLRPHHDFRVGSASHRYRASKIATPSALSLSRRSPSAARDRGLRLVALVLPLGEQRELVRCPIGPSGWHGRRVAFVRRKCFEHFVSIVRIGHEGVIVQLYAVRLHVRNIDIAKQWPDITRERNLGHNVLLPTGNAECEICKQNIKTKLYLLGCASRGGKGN